MPVKTYDMPLISTGLRQEEFIRQMVDSLEYLEAVSTDIFNRISNSVAQQRDKLIDVNTRINKAEAKVEKLRSTRTKGTVVFSLPKYPAPPVLEDQRPIFSKVEDGISKVKRTKGELLSKLEPANDKHLKDSTAYFILPAEVWPSESELMEGGFHKKVKGQLEEDEGLGSLPRYLPSIASLLLFNTSENPYLKYIISDPLSGVINKTREPEDTKEGPSAAPYSILTREDLTHLAPAGLEYHPIMGEIPQFDVPTLLPDLPNVAENIVYEADLGPSIAPSLANVELPTFADVETSSIMSEAPPSLSDLPEAPTPLPPEPLDMEPPPPDHLDFGSSSDSGSDEEDSTPANSPQPGDDRGALLDAIRAFKKDVNLKPMDQRMVRKAQKQKKKDDFGGGDGDVMNDLKDRLLLRRKGISGHKQDKGSNMLERMSLMIPAPMDSGANPGLEDSTNEEWSS